MARSPDPFPHRRREREAAERREQARHQESVRHATRQTMLSENSLRITKRSYIIALIGLLIAIAAIGIPIAAGSSPDVVVSPEPPGPDDASVTIGQDATPVWDVPFAVQDLGTPPAYTPATQGMQEDHCDEWADWLNQKGAAPIQGLATISVSAPSNSQVTITDARVEILRKYAAPATSVQCLYGADGYPATPAEVDLDSGVPILEIQTQDGEDLTIGSGRGTYRTEAGVSDTILIFPKGTLGYMYEWQLSVTYTVNAESITLMGGNAGRPFRTFIREDGENPVSYDYDQSVRAWQSPAE